MKIVVALGGNALLQRGEPLEAQIQHRNIASACASIAKVATNNQIILTHGNGPQVGLLALQNDAYKDVSPYPLYVLGAETQGMIGALFVQELKNNLPNKNICCLLTHVLVDETDSAFKNPTKFVGPVYDQQKADALAKEKNWTMKQDGKYLRRVVPSPHPKDIVEISTLKYMLEEPDTILVCAGGGGIPVVDKQNKLSGIDAVIDKDKASSLLAKKIQADAFIILSDISAVETKFGEPDSKKIKTIHPDNINDYNFAAGSMKPKIEAAVSFVDGGGQFAIIGELTKINEMLDGKSGTRITKNTKETQFY
jgi:carbamate kinase